MRTQGKPAWAQDRRRRHALSGSVALRCRLSLQPGQTPAAAHRAESNLLESVVAANNRKSMGNGPAAACPRLFQSRRASCVHGHRGLQRRAATDGGNRAILVENGLWRVKWPHCNGMARSAFHDAFAKGLGRKHAEKICAPAAVSR